MRLQDKVVLITSAQHPCAGAIAAGFARQGASGVAVDRDADQRSHVMFRDDARGSLRNGLHGFCQREETRVGSVGRKLSEW